MMVIFTKSTQTWSGDCRGSTMYHQ